jgi:hypothetical protein
VANLEQHPPWCDPSRCEATIGGVHESQPARVSVHRRGVPPSMIMALRQKPGLRTILRIVIIGEVLISTFDLDLDTAHLAVNTMSKLIATAAPPTT